uniref:RNase H type-1 domain-containing protein n=1 Tax=Cannabis sativa TaxID=3483 RepID=A0A803NH33_CANSA
MDVTQAGFSPVDGNTLAPSYYKLSVDAVADNSRSKIGIGATVRNFSGEAVVALSSPLNGNLSPLLAEAKALVSTLNWCTAVKFPLSVVESDYKVLIGKVKHKWKDKSALSDLVSQIVSILSNFPTIIVHHVSR